MNPINQESVVFVGAGPVGLWAAVQTKLLRPELGVAVLEKNAVYARSHVLKLNAASLAGCPKDPRLQKIVQEFIQNKNIRTNEIEGSLLELAKELGINIRTNVQVTSKEWLLQEYPHAQAIIGADGAHSTIREQVFDGKLSSEGNLKFIIELKYEVYGKGRGLNLTGEKYPTLKVMDALAQEHIGVEKDGKTPITCVIFVNEETFNQMRDATFKDPYTFKNRQQINAHFLAQIETWLRVKQPQTGARRVPGSEKITTTPLGYYASEKVVKMEGRQIYALVGDAAFGTPFFTSLNHGLKEGTYLAEKLSEVLAPKRSLADRMFSRITLATHDLPWPLFKYSLYVSVLAKTAIIAAAIKSFLLSMLILFIRVSARVPWQTNYWSEEQIQALPNLT